MPRFPLIQRSAAHPRWFPGAILQGSFIFLFLVLLVWHPARATAPEVSRMFPAGGQVGTTVSIKLSGKVPADLQVWCSDAGISAMLPPEDSKIDLSINPEVTPGRHWIRFHNAEGATELLPFLVGHLPERNETEPNNAIPESIPDESSEAVPGSLIWNGVLHKAGEVDLFPARLRAGQTLIASLDANSQLAAPMDSVLQVVSQRGFVLEQNDDHHGVDPRVVYTAPSDQTVFVRVFAFPSAPNSTINFAGSETYVYRLSIMTGAVVDHVTPRSLTRQDAEQSVMLFGWNLPDGSERRTLDATSSANEEIVLNDVQNVLTIPVIEMPVQKETQESPENGWSLPVAITGHLLERTERDLYRVLLEKDQQFRIRCEAQAIHSPVDPVLRVLSPDGKLVKEIDDPAKAQLDAQLELKASVAGTWTIEVRDRFSGHGPQHVYQLIVEPVRPELALSITGTQFLKKAGEPLKIEVAVARSGGLSGDVQLSLEGLPEGLVIAPVTVASKDKKATLEITGDVNEPFAGLIEVRGWIGEDDSTAVPAQAQIPGHTVSVPKLWLTAVAPESLKPNESSEPKEESEPK